MERCRRRCASSGRRDLAAVRCAGIFLRTILRALPGDCVWRRSEGENSMAARPISEISQRIPKRARRWSGRARFLIAYNVDLATRDAAVAQAIARKIRASSGGFPHVKAMGIYLASRDCAQVSMNLTNFAETPLDRVYDAISRCGARAGTEAVAGEIIGFIPRRAYRNGSRVLPARGKLLENRGFWRPESRSCYNESTCW